MIACVRIAGMTRAFRGTALCCVVMLVSVASARAATITVTSAADSTSGDTVREAIASMNAQADANSAIAAERTGTYGTDDTIVFSLGSGAHTITLTDGQLGVTSSHALSIDGPGASLLTISGNDASRVLNLSGTGAVTVSGLTLTDGQAQSGEIFPDQINAQGGGAIFNNTGTLTLKDDTISDSKAGNGAAGLSGGEAGTSAVGGGGIENHGGTLTVTGSTITGNSGGAGGAGGAASSGVAGAGGAGGIGGGIYTDGGTVTVDASTISGNQGGAGGEGGTSPDTSGKGGAGGGGGGIAGADADSITILASAFSNNDSGAGGSGGEGSGAQSGNGGDGGDGGAVYVDSGQHVTVTNTSFSGDGAGIGGGVDTASGSGGGTAGQGGAGGALAAAGSGTGITITGGRFSSETAGSGGTLDIAGTPGTGGGGGALWIGAWPLALSGATLSGDHAGAGGAQDSPDSLGQGAPGGPGGALELTGSSATVTGTTLSGDTSGAGGPGVGGEGNAGGDGGAVEVESGASLSATNDTIAADTAGSGSTESGGPGGAGGSGGALSVASGGSATLASLTIAGNAAGAAGSGTPTGTAGDGDGIFDDGNVTLKATLIDEGAGTDCAGSETPSNGDYNLEDGTDYCISGDVHADPLLGPLQANGGPTETMALGSGSPAIEAVPEGACPATDQRGVKRPQVGSACDIGAYEVGPATAAVSPSSLRFGSTAVGATSAKQTVTITNSGGSTLSVSGVTVSGPDASDFTITSDGCAGQSVLALASCTLTVSFSPRAAGARTATLQIADSATGSPQTVALSGTGTGGPKPGKATLSVSRVTTTASGVKLQLRCAGPAGTDCPATVTLTATEKLRGKKVISAIASATTKKTKTKKRKVTFATHAAKLAAGQTKKLTLTLSRSGKKLLKALKKLRVTLTVRTGTGTGAARTTVSTRTLTIKAPKTKHRRK